MTTAASRTTIRLERGAPSGVEARLLVVPLAVLHVWALTDDLVVTVAGDLGRTEAESPEAGR